MKLTQETGFGEPVAVVVRPVRIDEALEARNGSQEDEFCDVLSGLEIEKVFVCLR